jgi:hypothetical protein
VHREPVDVVDNPGADAWRERGIAVGRKAGVISADDGRSRRTLSEREVANCRSEGCHTEVAAREVEHRVVRAFDVAIQPFSYCHARMSLFIGQKMTRLHVANRPPHLLCDIVVFFGFLATSLIAKIGESRTTLPGKNAPRLAAGL